MSQHSVDRAIAILKTLTYDVERGAADGRGSFTKAREPVYTEIRRLSKKVAEEFDMSEPVAMGEVLKARPDLAARYRAERAQGLLQWQPAARATKTKRTKEPVLIELEAVAKRLQSAAAAKDEPMTEAQVLAKAVEVQPDLYAAYRQQRRQG